MSLPRDSETEVNEKLLNKPYSQVNNNSDPKGHGRHHQTQQVHQHPHQQLNGKPTTTSNNSSSGSSNNHYQNFPLTRTTPGTSSRNDMGSSDLSKETLSALEAKHELQRQVDRIRCYLKAMFVICVAFFLITIITFSVLFVKFRHDLDYHTHKPKVGEQIAVLLQHEKLCVPCYDYKLGPSPEEERMLNAFSLKDSLKDTDGGLDCCVDTPNELLELLKMFVERRFRQEMAKGTITPFPKASTGKREGGKQPIAAHLLMTKQNMKGVSPMRGRQYPIGHWIHENDAAFTIGTSYQHGRIVIPEDGFYFVYSQISFMEYYNDDQIDAFKSKSSANSPSLSHYLYRYNIHYHNGGEEKLAQNSITKWWGQSRLYGEYTSYLGAVFYLRNADEIFIKVSNITIINTDPKLSYFGLFQI